MTDSHLLRPSDLLDHWLGHRRLTRRVIEAFPDEQVFTFAPAPPMRPFGEMVWEVHGQTAYNLNGLLGNGWGEPVWERAPSADKTDLLAAWDNQTAQLERELPAVAAARSSGWPGATCWCSQR
jgi:hypothetical protein